MSWIETLAHRALALGAISPSRRPWIVRGAVAAALLSLLLLLEVYREWPRTIIAATVFLLAGSLVTVGVQFILHLRRMSELDAFKDHILNRDSFPMFVSKAGKIATVRIGSDQPWGSRVLWYLNPRTLRVWVPGLVHDHLNFLRKPVVFLSSTFADLRDERELVYKALNDGRYHVIWMESGTFMTDYMRTMRRFFKDVPENKYVAESWSMEMAARADALVHLRSFSLGSRIDPSEPQNSEARFVNRHYTTLEFQVVPWNKRLSYFLHKPFLSNEQLRSMRAARSLAENLAPIASEHASGAKQRRAEVMDLLYSLERSPFAPTLIDPPFEWVEGDPESLEAHWSSVPGMEEIFTDSKQDEYEQLRVLLPVVAQESAVFRNIRSADELCGLVAADVERCVRKQQRDRRTNALVLGSILVVVAMIIL